MASKTKRWWSILALSGLASSIALSLFGASYSLYQTTQKINLSTQFNDSYNIHFDLNNGTNEFNQPIRTGLDTDYDDLYDFTKQTADNLSTYLSSQSLIDFNVYYGVSGENDTQNGKFIPVNPYIDVNVPIIQKDDPKNKSNEDKKINLSPTEEYFNILNSSRLCAIDANYDGGRWNYEFITPEKLYALNENDFSKAKIDYKDSQVNIQISPDSNLKANEYLNAFYERLNPVDPDNGGDDNNDQVSADEGIEYLYLIKDMNGLINELNYAVQTYVLGDDHYATPDNDPYSNWTWKQLSESLTDQQKAFSEKFISAKNINSNSVSDALLGNATWTSGFKDFSTLEPATFNSSEFIDWIDRGEDTNEPKNLHTGQISEWASKYVLAAINKDNITTYLTNKDPSKSDAEVDEKGNIWLTISVSNVLEARILSSNLKDGNFLVPQKTYQTKILDNQGVYHSIIDDYQIRQFLPSLNQTFYQTSALIGMIIAIGILILLIGILISILYRIPGALLTIMSILTVALTLLILTLSGHSLSVAIFFGLIIGFITSMMTGLASCEKVKKYVIKGLPLKVAILRGLTDAILTAIDSHIVLLIVGFCFIYFTKLDLVGFGICLSIYASLSFLLTFVIWSTQVLALSFNSINATKNNLWFNDSVRPLTSLMPRFQITNWWNQWRQKKKPNKAINPINANLSNVDLELPKFETSYINRPLFDRFNLFAKWQIIVLSIFIIGFIVAGILVTFYFGINSSIEFYGGTRVIVTMPLNMTPNDVINYFSSVGLGNNWTITNYLDGQYLYLLSSGDLNYQNFYDVLNDLPNPLISLSNISVESVNTSIAYDYTTITIKSLAISSGFLCLYLLLRTGIVGIIPVFMGSIIPCVLLVAFIAICQIPFNTYVNMTISFVFIISAIQATGIINQLDNYWVKKHILKPESLQYQFNIQLACASNLFINWMLLPIIALISLTIFASTTLSIITAIGIVGIIFGMIFNINLLPLITYAFVILKNKYSLAVINNQKNRDARYRKNYDKIDEQLIPGINQQIKNHKFVEE